MLEPEQVCYPSQARLGQGRMLGSKVFVQRPSEATEMRWFVLWSGEKAYLNRYTANRKIYMESLNKEKVKVLTVQVYVQCSMSDLQTWPRWLRGRDLWNQESKGHGFHCDMPGVSFNRGLFSRALFGEHESLAIVMGPNLSLKGPGYKL